MDGHLETLTDDQLEDLNDLIEGLGEPVSKKDPSNTPLNSSSSAPRILSSQKMRYEAEVSLIKKKWGSLEEIRKTLGMSQRKMCQLLMVDPSAWTRWSRSQTDAPPHIYRSLNWFLLLQEKDPSLAGNPHLWLQSVARPPMPKAEIRALQEEVHTHILENSHLEREATNRRIQWLIGANITLVTICLILLTLFLLRP
jgi:transcriptional regulator with XRE-family HTH domain